MTTSYTYHKRTNPNIVIRCRECGEAIPVAEGYYQASGYVYCPVCYVDRYYKRDEKGANNNGG